MRNRVRRAGRRTAGLTLIELVAASFLAAILTVTLLSLMRVIWAEKERTLSLVREPAAQRLGELLRRDFLHARQVTITPNGVSLAGFLAHDPRTRTPTLRPALVTYRLAEANGRLLRQETHLDETPPTTTVEVAWAGVRSLDVSVFDDVTQAVAEERVAWPPLPGMSRVPSLMLVVVRGADGRQLCREEVVHNAQ